LFAHYSSRYVGKNLKGFSAGCSAQQLPIKKLAHTKKILDLVLRNIRNGCISELGSVLMRVEIAG
jgi:hypothetical protein